MPQNAASDENTSLHNKQNEQYVDEFHWSYHAPHDAMALTEDLGRYQRHTKANEVLYGD